MPPPVTIQTLFSQLESKVRRSRYPRFSGKGVTSFGFEPWLRAWENITAGEIDCANFLGDSTDIPSLKSFSFSVIKAPSDRKPQHR